MDWLAVLAYAWSGGGGQVGTCNSAPPTHCSWIQGTWEASRDAGSHLVWLRLGQACRWGWGKEGERRWPQGFPRGQGCVTGIQALEELPTPSAGQSPGQASRR